MATRLVRVLADVRQGLRANALQFAAGGAAAERRISPTDAAARIVERFGSR